MPFSLEALPAARLRRLIDPASLGFASTADLPLEEPGWIGQARAEAATRFGLAMAQADYNLFVLGEVGSGRSSLLRQALQQAAAARPTPPDLCYLHRFEAPRHPMALHLPPGQGRALRQALQQLLRTLPQQIPHQLGSAAFSMEADRLERAFEAEEERALRGLDDMAAQHGFKLSRDGERLRLALRDERRTGGDPLAGEALVQAETIRVLSALHEREQARDQALDQLQQQALRPVLEQAFAPVLQAVTDPVAAARLRPWVEAAQADIARNLDLFLPLDNEDEHRKADLEQWLTRLQANLVVDHGGQTGAPVVIDNNPQVRSLFGSVEHPGGEDAGAPDHTAIHAGGLLQAHGGFLMLHLQDLLDDELLWERLRRFLRSHQLQIEEPGGTGTPSGAGLQAEPVNVEVKLVLIGSPEQYYKLQDEDPEMARRFRVKVEFAERFAASPESDRAVAGWIACRCRSRGLPHLDAAAVAAVLEQSHREADDQHYQSALFGQLEALLHESAACCRARQGHLISAADVALALQLRARRHDYPEQCVLDAISDGERLISPQGVVIGQIHALSQVDTGDHRFGVPVRISARTLAGHQGVINIEREVKLSGPIHDKGVMILQGYLDSLFSEQAPLALKASLVFEQEYDGVEGDSASCAELFALLSSLAGLPLRQDIAVTGALNQHGEVLPVGGLNEKIESWFHVCQRNGLRGQGVLLPQRNERQLMLSPALLQAVEQGLFKVYSMRLASQGIALLTGLPFDDAAGQGDSVLSLARSRLRAYRRASERSPRPRPATGG